MENVKQADIFSNSVHCILQVNMQKKMIVHKKTASVNHRQIENLKNISDKITNHTGERPSFVVTFLTLDLSIV